MIAATSPAFAQAPSACEEESGAAYGLCNAYCEAMDCDSEQSSASDKACQKVQDRFMLKTGRDLPCIVPPAECPCYTYDEVADIAATEPQADDFHCFNGQENDLMYYQNLQARVGIPFDEPFVETNARAWDSHWQEGELGCVYRQYVWNGESGTEDLQQWTGAQVEENRPAYQACKDIMDAVFEAYSLPMDCASD